MILKKKKKNLKYNNSTNMDLIEAAIANLRLQDYLNISTTIRKYKVDRSKLSRRWNGVMQKEDVYDN